MGIETKINCDECSCENSFMDMQLEDAKERYFAEGGSESGGKYLCVTCTWRHRMNYFAIDVDVKGNRDYQVLAVVKDKDCFSRTRIAFGLLDNNPDVFVRRITQPEYATLAEFGIPAVAPYKEHFRQGTDSSLFYNDPENNIEPEEDTAVWKSYDADLGWILDLSGAVEELLSDKLPKAGTPQVIIEYFDR